MARVRLMGEAVVGTGWTKNVHWRIFFGLLSACAVISAIIARWLHLSFWLMLVIVVLAVLLNGIIAAWEDEQPSFVRLVPVSLDYIRQLKPNRIAVFDYAEDLV